MSLMLRRRNILPRQIVVSFNPLTQVTALHAVWAGDPSWSNPGDGNAVSSWRNQSGGGDPAQATGGAQPLYRSSVSQLGNRPAVEFDGSDDCLVFDIADVAQSFKVLAVFRFPSLPGSLRGIVGFGSGAAHGLSYSTTPAWRANAGSAIEGGTPNTSGHVLQATLNGASSSVTLDGSNVASGGAGSNSMSWLKLGCLGSGATNASFGAVQLAFYGVYAGATSDVTLAQLATDLKTHYGL
jgi:hypothetical protein